MKDPDEGLTPEGFIKTGVRRDRVPVAFEPVIEAVLQEVERTENELRLGDVSVYLYGSVATGAAQKPRSDVDVLTVGIPADAADRIAGALSSRFKDVCRDVGIAAASVEDFRGDADSAYGGRVFLRHYCVLLYGTDRVRPREAFPGDARAARGFNGDIGAFYEKWRAQLAGAASEDLGTRVARKSLLAVAGLVSVHDRIWTTDRNGSALRWADLNPQWRPMIGQLISWSDGTQIASRDDLALALSPGGIIGAIADDFQAKIGLWN